MQYKIRVILQRAIFNQFYKLNAAHKKCLLTYTVYSKTPLCSFVQNYIGINKQYEDLAQAISITSLLLTTIPQNSEVYSNILQISVFRVTIVFQLLYILNFQLSLLTIKRNEIFLSLSISFKIETPFQIHKQFFNRSGIDERIFSQVLQNR